MANWIKIRTYQGEREWDRHVVRWIRCWPADDVNCLGCYSTADSRLGERMARRGNSSSSMDIQGNNQREKDARGGLTKRECVVWWFVQNKNITKRNKNIKKKKNRVLAGALDTHRSTGGNWASHPDLLAVLYHERDRRRMGGGCTLTLNKRRTGAGFKSSRRLEGPSEAMQVVLLKIIYFISFFWPSLLFILLIDSRGETTAIQIDTDWVLS